MFLHHRTIAIILPRNPVKDSPDLMAVLIILMDMNKQGLATETMGFLRDPLLMDIDRGLQVKSMLLNSHN